MPEFQGTLLNIFATMVFIFINLRQVVHLILGVAQDMMLARS